MEHGTGNITLNKAFKTMKSENHQWLQNVYCLLCRIGLKTIWLNPQNWTVPKLKSCVMQRLNDMYQQKYYNYVCDSTNKDKCYITKLCGTEKYGGKRYLNVVRAPAVRALITKLRLDSNNTADCKFRSFRFKSAISNMCKECKCCDDVKHCLLECNKEELREARKLFLSKYTKYVVNFASLSKESQLNQILNVDPKCDTNHRDDAINEICKFIKNIYNAK